MKEIKAIQCMFSIIKPGSSRIKFCLIIFYQILGFPAFIFHEFMHIFFIVMCGNIKSTKIIHWHFYDILNNSDGSKTLRSYCLGLSHNGNSQEVILSSIAPLLGWVLLVIFAIVFNIWILLAYCLICFKVFFLSDQDIETMRITGFNDKACNLFKSISKTKTYDL